MSRSSSTSSCSINVCASCGLPWTTMSPVYCALSFSTSSITSPCSTVVLFHSGCSRVEDTTYLGIVLNLSANAPSTCGQTGANPSYVTRPSRSASDAIVSSTLNSSPCGPRRKSSIQPTRSKSSVPLGASTTPSTEMYSVTTILPIGSSSTRSVSTMFHQVLRPPGCRLDLRRQVR